MGITDEMLMAYADGQLGPAEASEVERALAEDPGLAEKVALMSDARMAVKRAYRTAPPVPAALEARVRAMVAGDATGRTAPTNVIDLAARRRVVPLWQVPAAAVLALAVGAGSVWLAAKDAGPVGGIAVAGHMDPAMGTALGTLPSGQEMDLGDGARLIAVASFRDEADRLCREFEHDVADAGTVVAVACREGGNWNVHFAIAAPATGEGYAPASSLETLDAYLTATGAGTPLSPEEETAALAALD